MFSLFWGNWNIYVYCCFLPTTCSSSSQICCSSSFLFFFAISNFRLKFQIRIQFPFFSFEWKFTDKDQNIFLTKWQFLDRLRDIIKTRKYNNKSEYSKIASSAWKHFKQYVNLLLVHNIYIIHLFCY